ncbi:MAG: MFS transporter [Methanomassiliicoccus sp.]|nr:MFS transporter [Methanomassiliicoccus sp.]
MAILFVMVIGLVSLMADVAIEGTKSVTGSYLILLGASAGIVTFVAGLSELVGYSLRIFFGRIADETGRYWAFVFIGYGINVIAVPALALAGSWEAAVALLMLERVGRAVRGPARDAMLSHAGKTVGRGWSYGVQEALSSVGGMIGPMVIVAVLVLGGDYRVGFEVLIIPALLAMVLLVYARRIDPQPGDIKSHCPVKEKRKKFPTPYWFFLLAGALIAAGYADFPLVAYHIGTYAGVSPGWIPIMYALAMAANALSALAFGRLYDRVGILPLVVMAGVIPFFVPLVFSDSMASVASGMMLYGIGFGAQESVMRAVVADMSPHCRKGMGFGCYNAAFGVAWFMGSMAMAALYDVSLVAMMALSMALQFAAIPLFIVVMRGQLRTAYRMEHHIPEDAVPQPTPSPAPAAADLVFVLDVRPEALGEAAPPAEVAAALDHRPPAAETPLAAEGEEAIPPAK